MTTYKLKLTATKFMKVGDEYKDIETDITFTYNNFDDLMNAVVQMINGCNSIKFKVDTIKEDGDE